MAFTNPIHRTVSLVALTAVAASAAATAAVPAAVASAPTKAAAAKQLREVCAKTAYVRKQPGAGIAGAVRKGTKVQVTRYSASGRFAHIVARESGDTIRGWMETTYLCHNGEG